MATTILTAGLHDYRTSSIEALIATINGVTRGATDSAITAPGLGIQDEGPASISMCTTEFGKPGARITVLKGLSPDDAVTIVRALYRAIEDPAGPKVLELEAVVRDSLAERADARRAAELDAGFRFVLDHDSELLTRLEDA